MGGGIACNASCLSSLRRSCSHLWFPTSGATAPELYLCCRSCWGILASGTASVGPHGDSGSAQLFAEPWGVGAFLGAVSGGPWLERVMRTICPFLTKQRAGSKESRAPAVDLPLAPGWGGSTWGAGSLPSAERGRQHCKSHGAPSLSLQIKAE